MGKRKLLLVCLSILLLAVAVTFFIFSTEPTASSEAATKKTAMLVDVLQVERGDHHPVFVATGTVQPVEDVMLSPLVGGQIIQRSPAFTPGGFVEEGELLLQIDPSDYRNSLELRKSELSQAQTALEMERGRQEVAAQDLELAGVDSLSQQERSLVLRKPQLEAVKARLKAAQAAVDQGELELSRTSVRAPFDAHILAQNVTVGAQVSPGDDLGRLVGTEYYWVVLTVPLGKLQWLQVAGSDEGTGAPVKLRNTTSWAAGSFREGTLYRQIGALDSQTRMARVLVRVPDPLAYHEQEKDLPELMIGAFIQAQLQGTELQDVVRLNRDYVRRNETVWVMQEGKLSIRDVEIVVQDSKYAYIKAGLKDGEKVVTTNLSTVSEGIPLRTKTGESAPGTGTPTLKESED